MLDVTVTHGRGFTRYAVDADNYPGRFESWTYADGRPPVYAVECTPARAGDIPADVLAALWGAMHAATGFVPFETSRYRGAS